MVPFCLKLPLILIYAIINANVWLQIARWKWNVIWKIGPNFFQVLPLGLDFVFLPMEIWLLIIRQAIFKAKWRSVQPSKWSLYPEMIPDLKIITKLTPKWSHLALKPRNCEVIKINDIETIFTFLFPWDYLQSSLAFFNELGKESNMA